MPPFNAWRTLGRVALLCSYVATTSCSRSGEDSGEVADKQDTAAAAMRDMSGMPAMSGAKGGAAPPGSAIPAEITLTGPQIQHGGIKWRPVVMTTAALTAVVPGQVVPNEDRTARLGAPASGRVIAVHVRPGDKVVDGQVLVTLQSPEAGTAQSDVAKAVAEVTSAKAQATYARSALERARRLRELKAIPAQDYERAVADDELAQAALTQAESELARARTRARQLGASGVSGEILIRSPLAGVLLARTAVPGSVVESGAPLVVVTAPTSLWLSINAPEALAGLFRVGGTLRFTVPAYPGEAFLARIDAVGAGLDPDTRTLPVRGVVVNATARLRPEMLASVVVEGGRRLPAAMLPDSAVQLLQGKTVVFLAVPDRNGGARFTWREVDVGSRAQGEVSITRGLAAGAMVVTAGAFAVKAALQKGSMPKMEM